MNQIKPELFELLRRELGFSGKALIREEGTLSDKYPIKFDLVIEDAGRMYAVELKRVVRFEALSQIGLMKLLLSSGRADNYDIEFAIAGKRITPEASQAAKEIGVRFIKLPGNMDFEEHQDKSGIAPVKLTSPRSWEVTSTLLKTDGASIRQLSIKSGVSYGWTHATVRTLASKGIVSDAKGSIKITNINKLLNGIAWERPFERLFYREIRISASSTVELAQEISSVCDDLGVLCAFTIFTAGEAYTGYSARHDTVYLYLEKKNIDMLNGMFDVHSSGGIVARIYSPDRDVFRDRTVSSVEGLWLVSPSQALLDCAGLGYAGRDITQKLVEAYGQL